MIRDELPQVAILVLSAHIEVEHAMDLLGVGPGIGYVLKTRVGDIDELCDTLERIRSGGSVVDPRSSRSSCVRDVHATRSKG